MSLSVDGALNVLRGALVTDPVTAAGAPTGTGISAVYTGLVPLQLHKVRIGFNAFTAAATTQDIVLWSMPAGFALQRIVAKVITPFTGGAVSDADITVGSTAGGAEFLASFDIDTAAITAGTVVAEIGASLKDASRADLKVTANAFAALDIQARLTTLGANVNALTAGQMDVYIIGYQLPLT